MTAQDETFTPQAAGSVSPFQILALDGGGAKALFTAHVLAYLEEDLDVDLCRHFDLIAGTSAGGIIALGLGAGLRPREIAEHYEQLAAKVFPRSRKRPWKIPIGLLRATYRKEPLERALWEVLGDKSLGDSIKRLVIPAVDAERQEVHIFKTPHHARLVRDWKQSMVDVARATSAAPVYFPAAIVDGVSMRDGGLWANNPSVVAIAEAYSMLDVPLEAQRVLNLGTTEEIRGQSRRLDDGGAVRWARPVTDLFVELNTKAAQGLSQHLVGSDRYHRVNPRVPAGRFSMDRADPDRLKALASYASRHVAPVFNEHFTSHVAGPYSPVGPTAEKDRR